MIKKLIINVKNNNILIALLENNKLVEFYKNKKLNKNQISVGDIFIGKINYISKTMKAIFIDIGYIKCGFLHFYNLGIGNNLNLILYNKINNDTNKIKIKIGQKILVQILKEPINNKGPMLTCKINLIGRYIILIPFLKKILISKKIKKKKREIIKVIKKKYLKKFGFIIRTSCIELNNKFKLINKEIKILIKKWKLIKKKILCNLNINKIYSENNFYFSLLRDNLDNNYKYIICNNFYLYKELKKKIFFFKKKKINYYNNNNISIFDKYNINIQIKKYLGKKVYLYDGSYLIIEHTEALHVIDINSNMNFKKKNINSLNVNLIAMKEIARQIRLRNMGGIIIIDCIDMINDKHKKKIYKYLKKEMKKDKYKHKILPPSKFNIIQITRHRIRQELNINNIEKYTYYNNNHNINNTLNSNIIESPFFHIKKIENFLNFFFLKKKKNDIIFIHTHPFIASYIKYGLFSIRFKWFLKYKKWINIISRFSFNYLEYKILNNKNKCLLHFKY
ncbi:MAG: ribonuclease E/G [Candidatus Shikimatogenerans bostrichidophilus]|nr:MAG: ribonuclease E/G [Candidatus Shikimatogenerans bostrichidophilus]